MHSTELLQSISTKSDEREFYTPIPKAYKKGKTKYVIVYGTVMSGLGKGIFISSLAKLLQMEGLKVTAMKFDGYLNMDAGTLNPYRHGEVFVLDDGTESDMDLGTYERFLEIKLTKDSYLTGGKLFDNVLKMERKGKYLGRDVQFIPHVTGEIKLFIRNLAHKTKSDVVFVEVGGTVGDIENMYFIEAVRELIYEEGEENVCNIALTYVLEPKFLGEQKSKAAQLGLKNLMSLGIQPDIIACRASKPINEKVKQKISVYANVPVKNVVSSHDLKSVYSIPSLLKKAKIDEIVINSLGLKNKVNKKTETLNLRKWNQFVRKIQKRKKSITVGMVGKYTAVRDSYASILKALEHAAIHLNADVNLKWIEATDIEKGKAKVKDLLKDVDGVVVPGGFGTRGTEGKIACVKYLRENNIPYLGLCYGFQMAVLEFARNKCGLRNANSTEICDTKNPVICVLPEQEEINGLGGTMRLGGYNILVKEKTLAHSLYNENKIRERFRHRWNVNTKYIDILEKKGMVFSGRAPQKKIMQILELPKHKFFIATQFHPEFTSKPLNPNPLFKGFVKACLK